MLYLRHDLIKGGEAEPEKVRKVNGSADKTGEQRGGKYAVRIQQGYEKDGSPRYKYFDSLEERDKFLSDRSKTDDRGSKKLNTKLKKEQKESKEKEKATQGKVESDKLFVRDKKEKDEDETKKSLSHFIWRLEE